MGTKTEKRLTAAINSVTQLKSWLERTLRKLDEDGHLPGDISQLETWLNEQVRLWQSRRDTEPKSSETYRYFDGKSEGFQSVLRYLEEVSGRTGRSAGDKGYLSGKDGRADESVKLTATMNLKDTVPEQETV